MNHLRTPLVSVGMPTYNAQGSIAAAVECLLAQDCEDFELIISDNASTDGTWDVVQDLAAKDPRIVLLRQTINVGANGNYSAVARHARGRYFKWASSNDWCAPSFLSRCVERLERDPRVVLVAPRTRLFDGSLDNGTDYDADVAFTDPDPVCRFSQVYSKLRLNNVLNGVVRKQVLDRTNLIEHYRGADVVLVAHLALMGTVELLDEHLFGRSMSIESATAMLSDEGIRRHHDPTDSWRALFPSLYYVAGSARSVMSSPLAAGDRMRALSTVAHLLRWRSHSLRLELEDARDWLLNRRRRTPRSVAQDASHDESTGGVS
jgi:glycosyltransferase involved in cell wall biosynthesis